MYLLLAFAYSSSDTFYYFTINTNYNISISDKTFNFTLVFFKSTCHANLGAVRKR